MCAGGNRGNGQITAASDLCFTNCRVICTTKGAQAKTEELLCPSNKDQKRMERNTCVRITSYYFVIIEHG